jgi:hypothetical protein
MRRSSSATCPATERQHQLQRKENGRLGVSSSPFSRSLMRGSKGSLGLICTEAACVPMLPSPMVYPSGLAFFTRAEPVAPPAPLGRRRWSRSPTITARPCRRRTGWGPSITGKAATLPSLAGSRKKRVRKWPSVWRRPWGCRYGWPPKSRPQRPATTKSACSRSSTVKRSSWWASSMTPARATCSEALPRYSFPSTGRSPSGWS